MAKPKKLNDRQEALLEFLEDRRGNFTTITEVCIASITNARLKYHYNTDEAKHDKCILLSNDVRTINKIVDDPNKLIIKDKFGSVKLVTSRKEFDNWYTNEIRKVSKKITYLNNMYLKGEELE